MEQQQTDNSLQDFLRVLKKRKLGMLAIFVGVVAATTIITLTQTPVYEIVSSIMVKYGREYVYRPVDQLEKGEVQPMLTFDNAQVINTELEIYRSKELIEKVITTLGVERLYPKLAARQSNDEMLLPLAINIFKKKLSVAHIKGSNVIGVAFQHSDPETAVKAVNLLTEFFKERHLQLFKNPQFSFLKKQVALYSQRLENSENSLRIFKQKNQIFSLEKQRNLLLEQYIKVKTTLIDDRSRADELEEKISSLKIEMDNVPEQVVLFDDSGQENNMDNARTNLLAFKIHERGILNKYQEDNRLLTAVRKDIKLVEDFLDEQHASSQQTIRTGRNPVYQELEIDLVKTRADYNAQQAKNKATVQQLDILDTQLKEFTAKEKELKKLQLAVETTEGNYKIFVSKLEENRILDEMDRQKMVNVAVIEKPMIPVKPIKPRIKLNLLVGIILGAASSMAYALLFDYIFSRKS